ncbi:MAG: molecular chaperone HtpG [Chloroflexota bacterium]|jgi:HSP90 family molecular chaperone
MEIPDQKVESFSFKAEIKQLLHILAHSLYQDRDIFLRELISNASDALTRLQFETLTNSNILDPNSEQAIYIKVPESQEGAPRQIIVKDTGIGMTHDEIVRNLGTIAQSGAREFMDRLTKGEVEPGDVIGQFGVGFYSVFMVAAQVRVVSRSFLPDATAVAWVSEGGDEFIVEPADKTDRGTEVHITLKNDAEEFANIWRLKQVVKRYSDYVRFPIYVNGEQANQRESLWRKAPSDVKAEEYEKFYQQMSMDFEKPLLTIHFTSDAPVHLRAMLIIPAKRDRGMLTTRKEPGVMLYSHNVLIQEYCTDLLPPWLNFVDGVVDSEDLPLNVSRETVQNNRLMQQLGKSVRARVLRELKKLGENDAEKYGRFWQEYGLVLKEGLATDPMSRDDILPLLRYQSSRSDNSLISLEQYVDRMQDSQTEIYYVVGDSLRAVANSPHLDPFHARELEVLYWHNPLDVFLAPMLDDFREKKFHNVAEAGLELPALEEAIEEQEKPSIPEADINRFIGRCVTTLGERVTEVQQSKVLTDNPVRLVAPTNASGADMQRIYRLMGREYEVPKLIFEINPNHPLIQGLATLITNQPDSSLINLAIEQLYESALLQEGLHPNPVEILPGIKDLIQIATNALNE